MRPTFMGIDDSEISIRNPHTSGFREKVILAQTLDTI
jgi:hypothetical protein